MARRCSADVTSAKPFHSARSLCHASAQLRRLLLLSSVLLLSCEVSRDLRPELFACDAGGLCNESTDSGIREVQCPFGGTCPCRSGESCDIRCVGQCFVTCESTSSCEVSCS